MNKLMFKLLSLIFVFMFVLAGGVFAADLSVKIETPKTPTRENNLKIGFVALDIQGRPVTVKCLKKAPTEAGFTQFGSDFALAGGGNSGDCEVTSSVIASQGTYEFKVSAQAGAESVESPVVSVTYQTDAPSTPSSFSKEQVSSCEYKIKFKTADDGKTSKVKIYRSDQTSFTADSGTEVGTVNIGPNLEGSFTNVVPDCGKTYYFAIRAFDDAGNASGITGDSLVTVETVTVSPSPVAGVAGAIPVASSLLGQGEILGVGGKEATSEGEILGEGTPSSQPGAGPSEAVTPGRKLFTLKNILLASLVIIILAGGYYYLRSKKQQ